MLSDNKPKFAFVSITGDTLKSIEKFLGMVINQRAIMPVWIITHSEKRYLVLIGSKPITASLSLVKDEEMRRTAWIPESDMSIVAETEGFSL